MTTDLAPGPLDDADPLARHRDLFVSDASVTAYLDGNSLGRPLTASVDRVATFMTEQWGGRLIRGWDDGWLELGQQIGDDLGRVALGAAAGQTTIGDSTTVLLYKLVRAAVDARPGRTELVIDRDNFPTDRYVLEGIAAERGLTLRWIASGEPTPEALAAVLSPATAVVVLSAVSYRSGFLADVPALTALAHEAGALILWDLCHSAGVVPTELDGWGVDLAVGCTYKYLNGGPGSPAFAYVATRNQRMRQPIQGWLGSATPFEMGQGYEPAEGIRAFTSGTPPIVGMLAMRDMIALIEEVGIDAVRAKSVALTEYAVAIVDELLPSAVLASPRDQRRRGSHVTIDHDGFEAIMPRLWQRGVIPDFRRPNGIRLGLSPLSTSFAEVAAGVTAIAELVKE
ncbi:aminotransferase class V-fold PLP-dependent enzyme [Conyzicola nivalis]|uniref:Kynureninase n=1 Tax=Conyzicola nivalis TaxID=1477021 RepID=A0A916SQ13_9MICO|nr:aminotransferase class V-fold PLP-dependent enzyme [Conyzicola nivalis]GGB07971.1 kynureninase [Conyzicola nivalis]